MRSTNTNIESDTEECLTVTERTSCTPDTLGLEDACPTAKLLGEFLQNADLETEETDNYPLQFCNENSDFDASSGADVMKCEGLRYVAFKL